MLVSQIDYNLVADIVQSKESVKKSVEAVMEGSLTASHLASDVYVLLEQLDKLEDIWRGTPPMDEQAVGEEKPAEQPPEGQQ